MAGLPLSHTNGNTTGGRNGKEALQSTVATSLVGVASPLAATHVVVEKDTVRPRLSWASRRRRQKGRPTGNQRH